MKFQISPVKFEAKDKSIEVGDFILTETVRSPGLKIPFHYHRHTNISFVLYGSFVETIGRKAFELKAGSTVFRPAGEAHENQYGIEHSKSLIIEVGERRLKELSEKSDLLLQTAHIRDNAMSNLWLRLHNEFRQIDDASPLAIEGLILEMLAQGIRQNPNRLLKKEPIWLKQAREFIHAEFSQSFGLAQVAKAVGVHPAHLAKVFRLHYRCTLGEYVRRLRLERAEDELGKSDKPISQIALDAGFYDQSHFTNHFKLRNGLTPSEFRALKQNGKFFPDNT